MKILYLKLYTKLHGGNLKKAVALIIIAFAAQMPAKLFAHPRAESLFKAGSAHLSTPQTTVNSVSTASFHITHAASVNYTVTFGGAVTGLNASNFSLTASGVTGASVGTPASSDGGTTWTVPVNTGSGDGSIQLNLDNATGLSPGISTSLPFAGDTYTIDKTPPTVLSAIATSPSNADTVISSFVTYTVTFSEPVSNFTDGISFNFTGSTSLQGYSTTGGSSAQYTLNVSIAAGSKGSLQLIIGSGGITDVAGNALSNSLSGDIYLIDNIRPAVSSVAVPADGNYTTGQKLDFTVNFDQNITVTGTPYIYVTMNTGGGPANYLSGSGTNVLTFEYVVGSGDADPNGIHLASSISANTGLADALGNISFGTLTNVGSTTGILVNSGISNTTINSIVAASSSPANASSVNYTVTFGSAVTGLTASNFSLTSSVSGASIGTPTTSDGGTTWTVPVNTGTGDGTIQLVMANATGLSAGISTSLPFNGDTFTIDKTAPVANTLVYRSNHAGNQLIAVPGDVVTLSFTASETIPAPTVTIGGHAITAVNSSGNDWSASYTVTSADPLGRIHFSTTLTDPAGNSTPYDDVAAGDDIEVGGSAGTLASLATSNSKLMPGFAPAKMSYNLTVGDIGFFTLIPTATDPTASITINGTPVASGIMSQNIPLIIGTNPVSIVVISADNSTTDTYTVSVLRKPSINAYLSNLRMSNTRLSPAFNKDSTSYTASVEPNITSVMVTPVVAHATSTVTVNGLPATSGTPFGPITLPAAALDTITTVVTAQDGFTTKTYTIIINHQSSNANVVSLKLSHGVLSPAFRQADTSYTAEVDNGVSSITMKPVTNDSLATVTVNGSLVGRGVASQPIALNVGPDTIKVTGIAANGINTKTYTIIITRDAPAPVNSVYQPISVVNPADRPALADNIVVHQGVSPNGDGMNDVLVIDGIAAYPDNKLSVMSRNGELVFEAAGYDNNSRVFDGHSNKSGKLQQPGTYFYSLDYKVGDVTRHKTGFLVLKY